MTSIIKAEVDDAELLAGIGRQTFIESHGHSAPAADIEAYINEKYNNAAFLEELSGSANIYYKLFYNNRLAGYSKIILNAAADNIPLAPVTKLERLYVLKEYYDLKLGAALLRHNIQLSKQNGQLGMWLYVWKENHRAVSFYTRNEFKIAGSYDFKISINHSNPNHLMLLTY